MEVVDTRRELLRVVAFLPVVVVVATSILKEAIREYAPFYNAKKNIQII